MQAVIGAPFLPRLVSLRLRTHMAAIVAAVALSACSTAGGEPADITGDSVDEINWSDVRTAELETEVVQLKAENAELEKQLASLRKANAETDAAAQAAAAEAADTASDAAPAPAAKAETVIAAAEAGRALADAPAKPVQPSPRLVQPSFASGQETVFENEAKSALKTSSVLYGVHLASYRTDEDAKAGWRKLQRDNPDELGLLEPRVEAVTIEDRGDFIRLIGGGFSSRDKAEALCVTLKGKGLFCAVTSFGGERLSFADPAINFADPPSN